MAKMAAKKEVSQCRLFFFFNMRCKISYFFACNTGNRKHFMYCGEWISATVRVLHHHECFTILCFSGARSKQPANERGRPHCCHWWCSEGRWQKQWRLHRLCRICQITGVRFHWHLDFLCQQQEGICRVYRETASTKPFHLFSVSVRPSRVTANLS